MRLVRHPLGTGFDVQLVMELPDSEATDSRDVVGIDLGVKAPCSLSNGAQYAPIKLSGREKKKRQRAVARAKRQSKARAKKKAALPGASNTLRRAWSTRREGTYIPQAPLHSWLKYLCKGL